MRSVNALTLLLSAAVVFQASAETGMCLVNCRDRRDGTSDFFDGDIRRIDLIDGVVQAPVGPLGFGCFPRFSPDGTRFVYKYRDTVKVATINGTVLRSWGCGVSASDAHMSWTRTSIYVGAEGRFIRYDTLGTHLEDLPFDTCSWGFVSQCDTIAAGVFLCCHPMIYYMNTGISKSVTDMGGCSACPSPSGAMISNNLWGPDPHQNWRVLNSRGDEIMFFTPQQALGVDESYYANVLTWSGNGENWMVLPVGQGIGGETHITANTSPWIFNVITHEAHEFAHRTTDHWQPHDYYSGWAPAATQDPSLQLSTTSLGFSAEAGGTPPIAQTVTASTPTGSLQGLSASGVPQWLTVSPSATSGTSIAIQNYVELAGLTPDTYEATINVQTDNAGNASYTVSLTVRPPQIPRVLTTTAITPPEVTLGHGDKLSFLATSRDQFDEYLQDATLAWSATPYAGTIDAQGVFTASGSYGGPYSVMVRAERGAVVVRDTALVVIARKASLHYRIAAGGNGYVPQGWEADDAYVQGGVDGVSSQAIDTAGVAGCGPRSLYRSYRSGDPHSYHLDSLPIGFYTVRLHLADDGTTNRSARYDLQGNNILTALDITTLAGGAYKALVLDFQTDVRTARALNLQCSASSGDVLEAGLEVIYNWREPITLLAPLGGETFSVGDDLTVRWSADSTQAFDATISFTSDNGRKWCAITDGYGIVAASNPDQWGNFTWTIPETLRALQADPPCTTGTVSSQCRIRVDRYTGAGLKSESEAVFTISSRSTQGAARSRMPTGLIGPLTISATESEIHLVVAHSEAYSLRLLRHDGTTVARRSGRGPAKVCLGIRGLAAGVYFVCLRGEHEGLLTPLTVFR